MRKPWTARQARGSTAFCHQELDRVASPQSKGQSLFLLSQSCFSDLLQHELAANETAYETDQVFCDDFIAQLFAMQGSCADVVGNVFEHAFERAARCRYFGLTLTR